METLSPTPIAPMPEQSLAVVPTTAEEMAPFEADYNGVVPVNNLPEADAPSTQLVRNEESKTDDVAETEQDLVVGIAGTGHDARLYAKDAGHEKHLSYLEEKSGVRNIARKIWSGVSGGAKRNKLDLESRQEIEANAHNNLFMHHGVTDEEWTDMARDTITRFTGEYEHSLDHDAGERGAEISNESDPNAVAIKTAVKGLIRDYAEGNLTDESFGEEKKRVLAELASNGVTSELLGEGATFADNLHDIAKAVVKRIGNERSAASTDEVIDKLKFVVGEARIGSRTEVAKNTVEKLADKLNCKWINETTAVAAASTVYAIGRWSAQRVTGTATRVAGIGVGAGVWAGVRARSESKSERQLLSREHAMGIERDQPAGKLESKLNETLHDSKNAREIISDMSSLFDEKGKLNISSPDDIRGVTALLADVKARQTLSGRNKIDLISYSDIKTSASERLQLMKLSATLHTQLAGKFNSLSEADQRDLAASGTFDGLMEESKSGAIGTLSESIDQKDALANRLHNIEFAKAFAKGTILGVGIGIVAQETMAFVNPNQQGAVEALFHHDQSPQSTTLIGGMLGEAQQHSPNVLSGHTDTANIYSGDNGAKTDLILPKEFAVNKGVDGYSVTGPDGRSVGGVQVGPDGHLMPQSMQEMKSIGLDPVDQQPHYTPVEQVTSHTATVSSDEFLQNHAAETTQVTRVDFANNGSSNPSGNELKLNLGGKNGFDAQGNVVMNIHGMTNGESVTTSGVSIDPQASLQEGKLSAYISVGRDSQAMTFKVPITPDGSFTIAHDSPISQMMENTNNQFNFNGGFIEIAQDNGPNAAGVEQITPLATLEGNNTMHQFNDVVQTPTTAAHYQYSFQPTAPPMEKNIDIDVPPVLPFYFRNTLKPRSEDSGEEETVDEPAPAPPSAEIARRRVAELPPAQLKQIAAVPPVPPANPTQQLAIDPVAPTSRLAIEAKKDEEEDTSDTQGKTKTTNRDQNDQSDKQQTQSSNDTDKQEQATTDDQVDNTETPSTIDQEELPAAEENLAEWEEEDKTKSAREMALKYGFPFSDSLPYANRWSSSIWKRAGQLLKHTMEQAEDNRTSNTLMLRETLLGLERDATRRGENLGGGQHRSTLDAGVSQLLTEVLSIYRASRKKNRAA